MSTPRSDALVFFGATGDLAYKKIFPALQALARRGRLDFLVIGVAKSGWTRDQLIERARASVTEHGGGEDPEAFAQLVSRLHYVDGDYQDAEHVHAAASRARGLQPPGPLSGDSAQPVCHGDRAAARRRLRDQRTGHHRKAVRPRSADGAGAEPGSAQRVRRSVHLPHRPLPRQRGRAEHPVFPLRQRVPRADLEPPLRRERADHAGGKLRRQRPRQVLRGDRRGSRRDPEPSVSGRQLPRHGGAVLDVCGSDSRRAGEGAEDGSADGRRQDHPRAVSRLPRRAGRRPGLGGRRLTRRCASRSIRGAGPACRSSCVPENSSR